MRVACVQTRSGCDINENIQVTSRLIRSAYSDGAQFIATPEMTSLLDRRPGATLAKACLASQDIALAAFRELAAELGVSLLIGSLPILTSRGRCANRSFLISDCGDIIVWYDKIHMFDVKLGEDHRYQESLTYRPGERSVIADVCGITVGLTICYDLRFPNLYRDLAQAGAKVLAVPSSFTRITGIAHWHVLLRARAIETGCFVMAPAQGGIHQDGRETYGHTAIVSPWGEVISELGVEPGYIVAEVDMREVDIARTKIPSLGNNRAYKAPVRYG